MEGEKSAMILKIWGGGWDLSSVDPDCLSVITYSKFMKAPLSIEQTIPSSTVTGNLPELQVEGSVFTSPLNIIAILRREGHNADFNLNSIGHADTLAYLALVEEKLKPALLRSLWVDSGNYINTTRKAYSKLVGFLRSYWNLPAMRNKIESGLALRGSGSAAEKEAHSLREAKNCITLLSNRLGDRDYFFGSTPTTFDAVAYSHLSLLLKAPLLSNDLKNHVTSCDNLCKYCTRITQHYFKDDNVYPGETQEPKKEKSEKLATELKEKRSLMLSVGVALIANIAYLLAMGIVIPSGTKQVDVDDVLD